MINDGKRKMKIIKLDLKIQFQRHACVIITMHIYLLKEL